MGNKLLILSDSPTDYYLRIMLEIEKSKEMLDINFKTLNLADIEFFFCENDYAIIPLCLSLKNLYNIGITGTIRKGNSHLPSIKDIKLKKGDNFFV